MLHPPHQTLVLWFFSSLNQQSVFLKLQTPFDFLATFCRHLRSVDDPYIQSKWLKCKKDLTEEFNLVKQLDVARMAFREPPGFARNASPRPGVVRQQLQFPPEPVYRPASPPEDPDVWRPPTRDPWSASKGRGGRSASASGVSPGPNIRRGEGDWGGRRDSEGRSQAGSRRAGDNKAGANGKGRGPPGGATPTKGGAAAKENGTPQKGSVHGARERKPAVPRREDGTKDKTPPRGEPGVLVSSFLQAAIQMFLRGCYLEYCYVPWQFEAPRQVIPHPMRNN